MEKGVGYLLALVERSFEFLLMLTLLSFFLGVLASFSVCWLEDEDEEELVLALESSSDIANPPPHPANGPCRGRKQNRNTDHAGAAKRELRCQEGAGRAAPAALQRIGAHRRTGRRGAGAAIARGRPGEGREPPPPSPRPPGVRSSLARSGRAGQGEWVRKASVGRVGRGDTAPGQARPRGAALAGRRAQCAPGGRVPAGIRPG